MLKDLEQYDDWVKGVEKYRAVPYRGIPDLESLEEIEDLQRWAAKVKTNPRTIPNSGGHSGRYNHRQRL